MTRPLFLPLLLCLGLGAASQLQAASLLGHGVQSCEDYLTTWRGWDSNDAKAVAEMYRYEDWLSGFISGLNLISGDDQLLGLGVDSVLRRNQVYCDEHPKDDFMTATMAFIRSLKDTP